MPRYYLSHNHTHNTHCKLALEKLKLVAESFNQLKELEQINS